MKTGYSRHKMEGNTRSYTHYKDSEDSQVPAHNAMKRLNVYTNLTTLQQEFWHCKGDSINTQISSEFIWEIGTSTVKANKAVCGIRTVYAMKDQHDMGHQV